MNLLFTKYVVLNINEINFYFQDKKNVLNVLVKIIFFY